MLFRSNVRMYAVTYVYVFVTTYATILLQTYLCYIRYRRVPYVLYLDRSFDIFLSFFHIVEHNILMNVFHHNSVNIARPSTLSITAGLTH